VATTADSTKPSLPGRLNRQGAFCPEGESGLDLLSETISRYGFDLATVGQAAGSAPSPYGARWQSTNVPVGTCTVR
jgi:hypothetical protein